MKYTHCFMQLSFALLILVLSGVILGSAQKLAASGAKNNIRSSSIIAMIMAVIVTIYSLATCKSSYYGTFKYTENTSDKMIHLSLGLTLSVLSIVIYASAQKIVDSVERTNIINSSVGLLAVSVVLIGDPVFKLYSSSL